MPPNGKSLLGLEKRISGVPIENVERMFSLVLLEIENGLSGADHGDRLAAEGFDPDTKTTAAGVPGRLKSEA